MTLSKYITKYVFSISYNMYTKISQLEDVVDDEQAKKSEIRDCFGVFHFVKIKPM